VSDLYTYTGGGGTPSGPLIIPVSLAAAEILNLTGVGIRADSFVFELLDAHHNFIGRLKASATSAATVENNTGRSIFRTCTGLTIVDGVNDSGEFVRLAEINPYLSRLRVVMVLQNGERFSLGVFMFGDDNRAPYSWGTQWTPDLFDESFIVDDPLDQTYGVAPGSSILTLVNILVGQCNLADVDFSAVPDAHASSAVTFVAGTSRAQAIAALLRMLGCYPPYFNNNGTYTTRLAPATDTGPDHIYGSGGRIIDGSIKTTNSRYRAPNRYQVIGSDPNGGIVGVYDLPDAADNSYAKTGDRVTATATMQGVPSVDVANLAAYINALTDQQNYVKASYDSTADPRHDTFHLVNLLGVQFQEVSWSIDCVSGGVMHHELTGYYPATGPGVAPVPMVVTL
jgi:hypothetical protein